MHQSTLLTFIEENVPDPKQCWPGQNPREERQEPVGCVHDGFDTILVKSLVKFWIHALKQVAEHDAVNMELFHVVCVIPGHMWFSQDRAEQPECVFSRHLDEEPADDEAHALGIADLGICGRRREGKTIRCWYF